MMTHNSSSDVSGDSSKNAATDTNNNSNNIVELATLLLPSQAAEKGLEVGEGNHFILEAHPDTVDTLQADMDAANTAAASSASKSHHYNGGGGDAVVVAAAATMTSQISAVVDFQVLSEIVGLSESVFIQDLYMDAQQQQQHLAALPTEEEGRRDEEMPLLRRAASSTVEGNKQDDEATHTAQISLPADPFIESLADALPTTTEAIDVHLPITHAGKQKKEERFTEADQSVINYRDQTVPPSTLQVGQDVTEAAATKADGDGDNNHVAHDGFLLNIPTQDSDGNLKDHFVLALPEILLAEPTGLEDDSQLSEVSRSLPQRWEDALSALPSTLELPTDVQGIHFEAHQQESKETGEPAELQLDMVVDYKVPIIGYVILISGLMAFASAGAALDLQQGPTPTFKTLWRQIATSLVLLPLVIKSVAQDGMPKMTRWQWCQLPVCALAYTYMSLAFNLALIKTTMANTFVLSNMTSLVIIAGRFVLGLPVLLLEGVGAVIGFSGAVVCAYATSRTVATAAAGGAVVSFDTDSESSMQGNLIALSASFGVAIYLICAKNLRSSIDLGVFMFGVMSLGVVFLILYILLNDEEISWGLHPNHGVWGWLDPMRIDRLPLELYMALVCNCVGAMGYVAVMKYFDPIVPATVMLMEPFVGALLGVVSGTAQMPGLHTWIGDVIVAAGTFCVIWSGSQKTETMDATKALRPTERGAGKEEGNTSVASALQNPLRHCSQSPAVNGWKQVPSADGCSVLDDEKSSVTKVVWDAR